ncbi:MAG: hypothetical protein ACREN2_05560 [Candidatus Dormibacteria bacterium]
MSGALSLALTPAPLVLALAAAAFAPRPRRELVRWMAIGGIVSTLALLALDAAPVVGGGRILASFGQAMPGIPYLFRADSVAMVVAITAAAAALLALLSERLVEPGHAPAILLCVLGSVVAAVAGNAVMLFAGVELANVGVFGLLTKPGQRPRRGALLTLGVEHVGALGLLAAAAYLQATAGTSDFSALPAGSVTAAVALPWAFGATVRLLAPAIAPLRGAVATSTWAATASVPTGAVMLLRLREAAGSAQPLGGSVALAFLGVAVALAGAAIMVRRPSVPSSAGRGLMLAVAGPVIALAGLPTAIAATAVAVGVGALEIAAAASSVWERAGASAQERGLAAAAVVAASGLPLGFGATAIVLELSAAIGLGAVGLPLLLGLGMAIVAAAAASVRVARHLVRHGNGSERRAGLPAPLGLTARVAAVAGAVVPGAFAGWLNGALGSPSTLADAGVSAATGPAGGWAGGYFVVAALVLGAAAVATLSLTGTRVRGLELLASPGTVDDVPPPVPPSRVRAARHAWRALRRGIPVVDGWIAQQPQLPLIAAGSVLAVVLIR